MSHPTNLGERRTEHRTYEESYDISARQPVVTRAALRYPIWKSPCYDLFIIYMTQEKKVYKNFYSRILAITLKNKFCEI